MAEDYPKTMLELERRFSDEAACREYLTGLRWPTGFVCPHCAASKSLEIRRDLSRCLACRKEVSVTSGTVFQDSKLPLTLWFRAMWQITSQKNGVSAIGLQRVLGLGSYKTAWTVMHKLRRAMVRPGRDRLSGIVEVDESQTKKQRLFVRGGFADVSSKGLTILAEQAIPVEDLNAAKLDAQISDAEDDVNDATSDEGKRLATEKLAQLREVRAALSL
jgi:transposase-like protein